MSELNNSLLSTARRMMADHKGLLAMDESIPTINQRFEKAGIPATIEFRRAYRELIVTTPGLGECLNGAIMHEETIYQSTKGGIPLVRKLREAGVIPGIKLDQGTIDLSGFPGEKIPQGLAGLAERLAKYAETGVR